MKTDLEIINENLALIPKDISTNKKVELGKKKLKFMKENAGLFSTGQYIFTLNSVKRELKEYKDILISEGKDE